MNLPLLSQLSMILPQDFPIEAPETLHSSLEVDVKCVKSCLSVTRTARILLVSGKAGQDAAILGAYFPKDSSPAILNRPSVIFQLAPVHRTFHDAGELEPSKETDFEDSSHLTLALSDMTLVLSGESATGSFIAQFSDGTSQEFTVDAVEVLGFEGCLVRVDTFE